MVSGESEAQIDLRWGGFMFLIQKFFLNRGNLNGYLFMFVKNILLFLFGVALKVFANEGLACEAALKIISAATI